MVKYGVLLCLAALSGCQSNSTGPTEVKREEMRLGAVVLSLPIGADGMVQKVGMGANWTFDSALWKTTIGQIGRVSALEQPQFGMLVRSDVIGPKDVWPSSQPGKKLDKNVLARTPVKGLEFYRDADPIFKVHPFYASFTDLDGFVECAGIADSDQPDLDSCSVHVREGNVRHRFYIPQGQLPFTTEVTKTFLSMVGQAS